MKININLSKRKEPKQINANPKLSPSKLTRLANIMSRVTTGSPQLIEQPENVDDTALRVNSVNQVLQKRRSSRLSIIPPINNRWDFDSNDMTFKRIYSDEVDLVKEDTFTCRIGPENCGLASSSKKKSTTNYEK